MIRWRGECSWLVGEAEREAHNGEAYVWGRVEVRSKDHAEETVVISKYNEATSHKLRLGLVILVVATESG